MTATTIAGPAPWFGRTWEHRHAALAAAGSLLACFGYWAATRRLSPDVTPGAVEFLGTATSLWSVWITQRRNVLALPAGIVSVVLMGWFFLDIGLFGQTLLHWAYYLPVQFWAWREWTRGGPGRTELSVSFLARSTRLWTATAMAVFTAIFGWVLNAGWDNALYTYWDASIVAASVVAMVLMSRFFCITGSMVL